MTESKVTTPNYIFTASELADYIDKCRATWTAFAAAKESDLLSAARAFLEPYKELSDEYLTKVAIEGKEIPHLYVPTTIRDFPIISPHIATRILAFRKIIKETI